ncbi:hypothetical protein ACLB2K_027002 [Fragaria x ananassa]
MEVEMDALKKNYTWDLMSLSPGKKTVGCRWVYTVKHNADGSVDRYKARLVTVLLLSRCTCNPSEIVSLTDPPCLLSLEMTGLGR